MDEDCRDRDGGFPSPYRGLQLRLFQFLQVPVDPPEPPPGRARWTRSFRADPDYLRYLKVWWLISSAVILAVTGIAVLLGIGVAMSELPVMGFLAIGAVLVGAVTLVTVQWLGIQLRYDATWYVMTDEALRNRRGLWIIQENTVSFDNVQNLSVRQGPLQRLFGIQDLVVETAAAGVVQGSNQGTEARALRIEGIRDAAELRDRIAERMRLGGAAGLGEDPRDQAVLSEPGRKATGGGAPGLVLSEAHLELLREIRVELGRLGTVEPGSEPPPQAGSELPPRY